MARTVAEIGQMVGCSTATVSRALNNSGAVSPKLREAVLKAIKESHYVIKRPRRNSKAAVEEEAAKQVEIVLYRYTPMERLSATAGDIAVGELSAVKPEDMLSGQYRLSNSFYRQIVDGMVEELNQWGHKAIMRTCADLNDPAFLMETNRPDKQGVLLFGEYGPDLSHFVDNCQHPLVLVDLVHAGKPDVVTIDNLAGIAAAFDHLYSQGHRKIGFVGRLDSIVGFAERYAAYKLKMAEADLRADPRWVYQGPNHIDQTAHGVTEILKLKDRPTAFLCANDCAALGVLRAAAAQHLRVPDDLSVVGFDDQESASMVTPPLTTVRVPMVAMGRQSVRQLMIQSLNAQQGRPRIDNNGVIIRLRPELVVRKSTAPVHGA